MFSKGNIRRTWSFDVVVLQHVPSHCSAHKVVFNCASKVINNNNNNNNNNNLKCQTHLAVGKRPLTYLKNNNNIAT